jgi:hypothetical protein
MVRKLAAGRPVLSTVATAELDEPELAGRRGGNIQAA